MATVEDVWLQGRIGKLEKRLRHHRDLDRFLNPNSPLQTMNTRAIIDMETKLFMLRKQVAVRAPEDDRRLSG